MLERIIAVALATVPVIFARSSSSSCSAPALTASYPTPSAASGYSARLVASGLQSPRGIKFDTKGRLLVVKQDLGIQAITFNDGGGDCLSVKTKEDVVTDANVSRWSSLNSC
jgi:glucose/arabinose dehydrogenase